MEEPTGQGAPITSVGTSRPSSVAAGAFVGDITSTARVTVAFGGSVKGSIRTAEFASVSRGATLTGSAKEHETLAPLQALQFAFTVPENVQRDAIAPSRGSRSVAPAFYKTLRSRPLSTLYLASGVYFANDFDVDATSKVVVDDSDGPVVVLVADDLTYQGTITSVSGDAPNLVVVSLSEHSISVRRLAGTLIAPRATVNLEATWSDWHEGVVFGSVVRVRANAHLVHRPCDFGNIPGVAVDGVGDTGPKQGTPPSNQGPRKGEPVPQRPGSPMGGAGSVAPADPDAARAQYGEGAQLSPNDITVPPEAPMQGGAVPVRPGFHARARFLVTRTGVSLEWADEVPDESFVAPPFLRGDIAIVGSLNGEPEFVTSALDPRFAYGHDRSGGIGLRLPSGRLSFGIPAAFIKSEATLSGAQFDVYELSSLVPYDLHMQVSNLGTLLQGAVLIGSVSGSDFCPYVFPNHKHKHH